MSPILSQVFSPISKAVEHNMVTSPLLDPYEHAYIDMDLDIPDHVWNGTVSPRDIMASSIRSDPISPLLLPSNVTIDKGKGRAPTPPTPTPMSPFTLPIDKGKGRAPTPPTPTPMSPFTLPSSITPNPASEFNLNLIQIPYGHPDIITSLWLNLKNCIIYKPLCLLICVVCQVAIVPSYLRRHRSGTPHFDSSMIPDKDISELVEEYHLLTTDRLPDHSHLCHAVPGLPWERGLRCTFPGCSHGRTSMKTMRTHVKEHGPGVTVDNYPPEEYNVQVFFDSNQTRYPVIVPELHPVNHTVAQPSMLDYLQSRYASALEKRSDLEDRAHLPPFLAKYPWHNIVQDLSPRFITNWVDLPKAEHEQLGQLFPLVQSYYQKIEAELANFDGRYTTILRWIKSTKK
jgi:hypothetical protein